MRRTCSSKTKYKQIITYAGIVYRINDFLIVLHLTVLRFFNLDLNK